MMEQAILEMPFVGWLRPAPRQRWRPVVGGRTFDEAWVNLLASDHQGDKMVTAQGAHPNDKQEELR